MGAEDKGDDQRIVVKKYANRRLYNTATSSYVTLDHLARLTQEGVDFVVYDAKSGEDITRSVLTQIIVEEEAKGENLLPIAFLRQLITFYGDNMRWMVPQYLEHMIQSFAENQDRMRGAMQDAMGNLFPFGNLEDMRKQNMAFFEQAMRVWSPFAAGQAAGTPVAGMRPPAQPAAAPPMPAVDPAELAAAKAKAVQDQADLVRLKAEVESLKAELEAKAKALQPAAVPAEAPRGAPLGKDNASPPEPANNPGPGPASEEASPPAPTPVKPSAPARRKPAAKAPATKTGRAAPAKTAAAKTPATKAPAAKRGRPAGSTSSRATKAQTAKAPDVKKN